MKTRKFTGSHAARIVIAAVPVAVISTLVMAGTAAFLVVQSRTADANGSAATPTTAAAQPARATGLAAGSKAGAVIDLDALSPAARVLDGGILLARDRVGPPVCRPVADPAEPAGCGGGRAGLNV